MRYPHSVHAGPLVFLCDEGTSSDGELFIRHVQELKLGPVVGSDTWGGLIGFNNILPVLDGGIVTQSNVGFFNARGEWIVENQGAHPDIVVEIRPEDVLAGRDPQLDKAVEICHDLIQSKGAGLPEPPPFPKR